MDYMDANGICDTLDDGTCISDQTQPFNLCDNIACMRDSQCASGTCGQTGSLSVCMDYNNDDNNNNGGDNIDWEDVVVVGLIVIGVVALLIGGFLLMKKRKEARL